MVERRRRVVVITGAASGMGAASARAFAADGADVVIIDRDRDGAAAVSRSIDATAPIIGDVSDSVFCRRAIDGVVHDHGAADVLVNCAGTIHRADALGTDDDDWRRVMRVNVDGTFFMCRSVIPHMVAAGGGTIVNFGSIWGDVGSAGVVAYCASKGAVHQLTRALALDHVADGIRVNAVAPGEVNTPMLASQRPTPPSPADLQALADATIPMKRLAEPEEIARVVLFLASDAASYMTGSIVSVDGGYTAR
jgi:meso-butanediol dehydrogenase / (S,S)-butanediol dehydrogenase / diacetyl reductase